MKIKYEKIDSTNEEAKRLIKNNKLLDNINLIIAQNQSEGRGTKGHIWDSNGDDIYMTISYKIEDTLNYSMLMMQTSLSIIKVLERYLNKNKFKDIQIKWPNDIYVKDRKIAGILFEKIKKDDEYFILIGIGLNVNRSIDTLEELYKKYETKDKKTKTNKKLKVTSIYIEENEINNKEKIIDKLYYLIEKFFYDSNKSNNYDYIYEEYLKKSLILNKNIEVINIKNNMKKEKYLVKNILKNGKLICINLTNNAEEKFLFNDINILSIN